MKLINKAYAFLSLVSVSLLLSNLEAKSLDFFLDHKTQETFNLQVQIPDQTQEELAAQTLAYCQQLTIENLGNQPLRNCFPYINHSPYFSLESLAAKLASEPYPLLALYHLWDHSLIRDETISDLSSHPLDLLHFKGRCSQKTFDYQFLKLCHLLGIETRIANVHGKTLYDFGIDQEWVFLDLANQQLYLGLDNEKLVSSEEIMDDPFLALRTKHHRRAPQIDFKEAWKQLAHFEILEPDSAMPILISTDDLIRRSTGVDLFPGEIVIFKTPANSHLSATQQCSIEHTLNLEARQPFSDWTYSSAFPLHQLVNNSSVPLQLIDQKIELQIGEVFTFQGQETFEVKLNFSDQPTGQLVLSSCCAHTLFPHLVNGQNQLNLGTEENQSIVRCRYEVDEQLEHTFFPSIHILNSSSHFDHETPYFQLGHSLENVDKIEWQIALDPQFQLIPANFDQIESFSPLITLPAISETFLNPESTYYFRVKGCVKGQWSEWSSPFVFVVHKPLSVEEVEFEQIAENCYELQWERFAEDSAEPIEYLVFGSNSLDFIPSIYCDKQVNAIVDGNVIEEEINDNLIAITTEPKLRVSGGLAYYRIVARKREQFSVPSVLIHIYDQDLIQPRNALQVVMDEDHFYAKRTLFPGAYPWTKTSLPALSIPRSNFAPQNLIELQKLLRSAASPKKSKYDYEFPDVTDEVWEKVQPYLLPSNHPAWSKLNRIFCQTRVTLNPDTFKKGGFNRWRPGRWSRVSASSHPECPEYFIKAYCDCELGIIYDWKKWIHRIEGAKCIRACIKEYELQENFKVPHKWIYPLPKHPAPPTSSRYARKNFILVTENMRIQDHKKNEKLYKNHMTHSLMNGIYTVLQVCGLYDSVYVFNMPFCRDGRIAIIDTEYHHKWPIPFQKLTAKFSKDLQSYWKNITFNGGKIPNGVTQPNPPRMDRRDVDK